MKYFAISLFPESIDFYTNQSILGRAQKNKIITLKSFQLRDFTKDKHGRTDGKVYGGGPGMALWVEPIINTFEKVLKEIEKDKKVLKKNILVVNFVPNAKIFTNKSAREYSQKYNYLIFICGRYEGVDARVNKVIKDILLQKKKDWKEKGVVLSSKIEDISVGDFVLTGGEIPAMIMIDAISRQIPQVLHDNESLEENRVASSEIYARPEVFEKKIGEKVKKYKVPKVLLSGHHQNIENWRKEKNLKK
ncbi:MAG: tRNA (guanosine(37)-N1)-methyltransferase TrmD [Candidatus Pacebacteria bacterium]|nr:tRNA (guanosine(37)-N1)-methyltransferase TrmD [Candidatus Paceibacterota bacterium]